MHKHIKTLTLFLLTLTPALLGAGATKKKDKAVAGEEEITRGALTVLWREPADIASRNLFYGPGGKEHEPHGTTFTFVEEDLEGSNPKFVVRDADGVKWKIKLGPEARPETAATRLVWGVGYYADEDYFLSTLRVRDMPAHLHRGQKLVDPDGTMHNARLKREHQDAKKIGIWKWRDNSFVNTREFNGLRVLMSVINNWDLKDVNNAVYQTKHRGEPGGNEIIYAVSDLGASFGPNGLVKGHEKSRGYLPAYSHSRFVKQVEGGEVDFETPRRPAVVALVNPGHFFMRLGLRWIGRHIPREDAKWVGQVLGHLSASQIGDAFRAAGYSPAEVDGFTAVLESRIAALSEL